MFRIIKNILFPLPFFGTYLKLRKCGYAGFTFGKYLKFRFLTIDKSIYWPKTKTSQVANALNIIIGKNCSIGNHGCYIQGNGKLIFGNYVRIAPNVGILSGNHNPNNQIEQIPEVTTIGDFCWIGMNAVVVPGVTLGPRTIVAAGSVVTKNFPDGFCIIGGNPAKLIKKLDENNFVPPTTEYEFYGYIPAHKFERFKRKHLK